MFNEELHMEKLVCSAIKFQIIGDDYFQIMCGKRHPDVFQKMFQLGIQYDKKTHVQGFLTNKDRFVDRYEAVNIEKNANQLSAEFIEQLGKKKHIQELYSEDVW